MPENTTMIRLCGHTLEDELTVPLLITRLLILDVLFEGDPLKWRSWLDRKGSRTQIEEDLPFVELLCSEIEELTGRARTH